jgi:phosphatidylinositol glycan class M
VVATKGRKKCGERETNPYSPYLRPTFRYTPLLPLLLSPTVLHPLLGKLVLVPISLCIPYILLWRPRSPKWAPALARPLSTHLLWTLNPLVLNITTRGSPEAVPVLLVVLTLHFLHLSTLSSNPPAATHPNRSTKLAQNPSAQAQTRFHSEPSTSQTSDDGSRISAWRWEMAAAVMYALSVSWKIYPVVYATAIWAGLSKRYGWFGWGVWRFGLCVLGALVVINGVLWSM